jgi:polyhydroxyalkanoate synthesis regulator phasin
MMHTKNEIADLVPVPNIKEFISQTVGPEGKMVPIGWSLEDERPVEIKDRRDYPSLSPEQASARDTLTTDSAKIALIKDMVKKGTLTAAQGMEEIMQLSDRSPSVAGEASSNTQHDIEEETSPAPEGDIESTLTPVQAKALELLGDRPMTADVIEEVAKGLGVKAASAKNYLYTAKKKVAEAS